MLCHGENRGCCFITYSDTVKELRFLAKLLHSCLTFFEGGHGCPKLNAQSFARMRNRQSVHMARMWCGARDSAVLEGLVQRSLSLATDKVERILKMLESQSKTIYGKK